MIEEPRKSEIEFRERLSKLLTNYHLKISKTKMIQFVEELLKELKVQGARAV